MSQTDEIRGERLLLVNDVQVWYLKGVTHDQVHKIVGPEKELLCQGVFEVIVVPQGAEDGSDICFFNIDNLQVGPSPHNWDSRSCDEWSSHCLGSYFE